MDAYDPSFMKEVRLAVVKLLNASAEKAEDDAEERYCARRLALTAGLKG
jgi:hypothetical protein